jgi:hypothetical protein
MSEARRQRLMEIQKREQIKGLLMSKFKLKYGNKPTIARYIDNEVQKFLVNDRLTERNLVQLDDKIAREAELREKKGAIINDRQSGRALSQAGSQRSHLTGPNLARFNAGDPANRSRIASAVGSQLGSRAGRSVRSKSISGIGSRRPVTAGARK